MITNYQNEFELIPDYSLGLSHRLTRAGRIKGKNGNCGNNTLATNRRDSLRGMAGRPLMNEWLTKELETATAELWRAAKELETGTLDLAARDLSRHQFDYWTGYANAVTNALHELTGMDNE